MRVIKCNDNTFELIAINKTEEEFLGILKRKLIEDKGFKTIAEDKRYFYLVDNSQLPLFIDLTIEEKTVLNKAHSKAIFRSSLRGRSLRGL